MDAATALSQELIDQFVGVCHGDVESVRRMLSEHPGLALTSATWGETPIQAAAQMGHVELAELLIAQGAPIDICTASVLGRAALVDEMIQDDPEQKNATGAHGIPLMYFPVIAGREDIAETLLRAGADVNAGAEGVSPLHGAAMFGRADMAKWLLAHGADPSALNYEGKTALQVAVENGHTQVVTVLGGAK